MIDRKNLGGLLAAGIGYSRLQTSPEFQRDMARAQKELRSIQKKRCCK